MSNTTSEHPVTPAAISVGSDGSPDQVSRHTPGDNARNLGDDSFLPEILEPIYDSQEQEKKVKMAVVLAELDRLHAAATAGEWFYNRISSALYVEREREIERQHEAAGSPWDSCGNYPEPWRTLAYEADSDVAAVPALSGDSACGRHAADAVWIVAAHNHYPALAEEIRRLREEAIEHEQSFDLYYACMRRATTYWQEKTGRKDTWPDTTALLRWLMDELATAKRDGAVKELRRLADEWARDGLPGSLAIRDRADELEREGK